MTRGITPPPVNIDPQLRAHLMDMYQTVLSLRGAQEPPKVVPNLNVTPLPGGNLVQWTTNDADYYQVLWSPNPSINNAQQAFAGLANQFADVFGAGATTRYYWVYSWKNNGQRSTTPAGPFAGTSGAVGTPVTPPTPPTPGVPAVKDPRIGYPVPRGPIRIGG